MSDYRDQLAEIIKKKFKNRNQFCNEIGINKGYLSRVLSKKRNFSIELFSFIVETLDYEIVLKKRN